MFQRIASVGENCICTSIIVVCELRFGVAKSGSLRLVQQIERILEVLPILSLEPPVDKHYAAIRTQEGRGQKGNPINKFRGFQQGRLFFSYYVSRKKIFLFFFINKFRGAITLWQRAKNVFYSFCISASCPQTSLR